MFIQQSPVQPSFFAMPLIGKQLKPDFNTIYKDFSLKQISEFKTNNSNQQPSALTTLPLFDDQTLPSSLIEQQLQNKQTEALSSASKEWNNKIHENKGRNRGTRVDQYAKAAHFNPGGEWCGFFVGFNYKQAGFKYTSSLASYQKARDFFLYRSYTNHSQSKNKQLDQLRQIHEQQGSQRQYFMLQESPNIQYISRRPELFKHIDLDKNVFDFQHLPIRPGDTILMIGHVAMVKSYDPKTGILVTLEGNVNGNTPDGNRLRQGVVSRTFDLSNPEVRKRFAGFGRPATDDFA